MGDLANVKRRCFTKAQKISILNELSISGISLSELARKYQISSVALYRWRRRMEKEITPLFPDYQHVVSELEKTKKENENLKKALGELAVEKQILQTSNEILKKRLLKGLPVYLGYIATAFKVSSGERKALPHEHWENKIASRVSKRVVDVLYKTNKKLITDVKLGSRTNKIGDVKHFHSLAASAQEYGIPIGSLKGKVNTGHNHQIDEAKKEFDTLAKNILKRIGIN